MRTFFIYNHFEIYSVTADFWHKGKHRHQFFELIYIEEGTGIHMLNANEHFYQKGDVCLLTPGDQHSFQTQTFTTFHCIRFLPAFFKEERSFYEQVFLSLQHKLEVHNRMYANISLKQEDKGLVYQIIQRILVEGKHPSAKNESVVKYSILLLLELVHQNLVLESGSLAKASNNLAVDNILLYVQQNIANTEQLSKKSMAAYFNLSTNYIGEYFKKQTGVSLREYTNKYRLKLIEKKMKQSELSNSQIGQELGFTDDSHFYKFIKKQTKLSPTEYRKALLSNLKNE